MMDKADRHRGKGFFFMQKAWKQAVAMAFLGTVACAPLAMADRGIDINVEYHQNDIYSPSYVIARDAMKDMYRAAEREGVPVGNPLIGIGEVDLNGDHYPEIIAVPTEEEEEAGLYCKENLCPHYILEVRDKKVRTLAVIFAEKILLGDEISNGYWQLLASKDSSTSKSIVYKYDKKQDAYLPVTSKPAVR